MPNDGKAARAARKADIRWYDRLLYKLSRSRTVEGLWISSPGPDGSLERVDAAVRLIAEHDPLRFRRLLKDFDRRTRACELDRRFVLAETTTPAMIAAVIVHEAAHARLAAIGIDHPEHLRVRIERLCLRREAAFARKLPDAMALGDWSCELPDATGFSDRDLKRMQLRGSVEALRELGWPNWLIGVVLAVRRWRDRRARSRK